MDEQMPTHYMICLNSGCPRAESCLRHIYAMQYSEEEVSIHALNPRLYPKESSECSYYRPMKKIRLAWGIKDLLHDLPYDSARRIKQSMLGHFGRTRYYCFFREERPLTPAEQTAVQSIFRRNGVESAPAFGRYSEEIDW